MPIQIRGPTHYWPYVNKLTNVKSNPTQLRKMLSLTQTYLFRMVWTGQWVFATSNMLIYQSPPGRKLNVEGLKFKYKLFDAILDLLKYI